MKNLNTEKIAVFHTGRGGRFYNPGHKTFKCFADSFNPEYYGIIIYYNEDEENPDVALDNEGVVCTLGEMRASSGVFDIDGGYNTYSWLPVSELDEDNLKLIFRDGGGDELYYILDQPEALKVLMELDAKIDDLVWCVNNELTVEDLIERQVITKENDSYYLV